MDASTELCPLHNRRSPRDLYVKLFVVNFIVGASFVQFLYRQNKGCKALRCLIWMLCPLNGAFINLGLPLTAAFSFTVYSRRDRPMICKTCRILFGRVPLAGTESSSKSSGEERHSVKWQLCVQLALLSQSATSVYLFCRRVSRGADVLYDHRIFQLSTLGICVVLMSIIDIVFRPTVPQTFIGGADTHLAWLSGLRQVKIPREPHLYAHKASLEPTMLVSLLAWLISLKVGLKSNPMVSGRLEFNVRDPAFITA